jgi:hypothetical protein
VRIKNQNRNSKLKMKFDIDIGRQKCKMENENQKGELKMENENQNPKPSFKDVFKIKDEICRASIDCDTCPFCKKDSCIMRGENIAQYVDEIEAICTEWESKKPTLADKINEIIKPYGMKLIGGDIWFDDDYTGLQTKERLVNKLYTTRWKGESNV